MWDDLAIISKVPTDLGVPPLPMLDLLPFHKDNIALASLRSGDSKLQDVVANRVQADDAGKYSFLMSHQIIDWKEETWVTRLFHCLKEKEEQLGIQVVNISQRGPGWQEWLRTVLFAPTLPTLCTPFKGVTDILLLGKNGFLSVAVTAEDGVSCMVDLVSNLCVLEVGICKSKPILCIRSNIRLPDKLGELIASMYLLGALKALTARRGFKSFKTYGLLLIRSELSVGVELTVHSQATAVNILWLNSDMDRLEQDIMCLVSKIK